MNKYRLQAAFFSFQSACSHQTTGRQRSITSSPLLSNHLAFTSPFPQHPSKFSIGKRSQTSMSSQSEYNVVVDPFCHRQFSEKESSKGYLGTVL
jgi:hypothetical protein